MTKIFISIPCSDQKIFYKTTKSLVKMIKILDDNKIGYTLSFTHGSLITRIRNNEVFKFFDSDCSHLLFIDSDVFAYEKYILDMLKYDKKIIGLSYPLKSFDNNLLKFNISRNLNLFNTSTRFNINLLNNNLQENYNNIDDNGLLSVKHLPTGFLLVKREVFEDLLMCCNSYLENNKRIYNFFDARIYKDRYLSEDYSFSQLCIDAGIKLYCLTTAELGHIGTFDFLGNLKSMIEKYKFFNI